MFDAVALLLSSKTVTRALSQKISAELGLTVEAFPTLAAAQLALAADPRRYLAAITHPTFTAERNRASEAVMRAGVPCVVLTSAFSGAIRDELFSQGVADYVVKEKGFTDSVVRLLRRMREGRGKTVLVVDDSRVARKTARDYLQRLGFNILEASTAERALELLEQTPYIRMVLTDHEMPGMNGSELVTRIRERWGWEELCVIGISSSDRHATLTAEFLKRGANDYVSKPFQPEELSYRVFHNLELAGYLSRMRDAQREAERLATIDPLTGALNRRAFFERGAELLADAAPGQVLTAALLDLDHFKSVNDTHGHAAGDAVLVAAVEACQEVLGEQGLFSRVGGEEFAFLLPEPPVDAAVRLDRVRAAIAARQVEAGGRTLQVTASLGLAHSEPGLGLDALLQRADAALYQAKAAGRDRVVAWSQERAA